MSYNNLYFSKFTHRYERDGIVAVFHSLKMKPIFIKRELLDSVKTIIESSEPYTKSGFTLLENGDDARKVIELLVENRVLNEAPNRDHIVLDHFKNASCKPHINIAYFILAESCNLSCSYCFEKAPSNKTVSKIMKIEVAEKSLLFFERMLANYPATEEEKEIIFYGGEPLLNYDVLMFLLKEIKNRKSSDSLWKKVNISLVTNGTLLTEEMAKKFKEYGLSLSISVDGPVEITNKNRYYNNKKPAFSEILRAIDICKKVNLDFSLSITLSVEAVKNYRKVVDFVKEVKPASIGFNVLLTDKNFSIYDGYNEEAAAFLIEAFKEFRSLGLYEDRMMRKVKAFVKSQVYAFDCGATGANQLVFSASGKIGICHGYLQDKKFFPTDVDDNEFSPETDKVFQEWARRTPLNMEACQNCEALGICGGGCPMNAERNYDSIWALDERFCVHAKKTLEWLIWDLFEKTNKSA